MTPRPRGRGLFRHGFKNKNFCPYCGREVPTTRHHIYGRKHSDAVEEACEDCHKKFHFGDGSTPYGDTDKNK